MATTSSFTSLRLRLLLPYVYLGHYIVSAVSAKESTHPQVCGRGIAHPLENAHQPLCIDDTNAGSEPTSFSPWTHRPFCIEAAGSPWCVFTNADPSVPVAGGVSHHGISIVTTPEQAAGSMDVLEHISMISTVNNHLAGTKKRPYKVVPISGKGLGAIAKDKIRKGQVVLVDRAMVLSAAEYPDDVLREEVQALLGMAVDQLPHPEKVYALSRKGRTEEEGFSDVEDLLLSNSFLIEAGESVFMGLFPDLARLNHACHPNTIMHFSEKTLAMTVVATKDIELGEELSISYIDTGLPYKERQETLRSIWGFNCTCSLCSASPEERKASDDRRMEIQILKEKVVRVAQRGEFPQAIETSEKLFKVIEAEGLEASMTDMYEIPGRLYYHVGKLEKASEYTERSLRALEGFVVPGSKEEKKVEMLRSVLARIQGEMEEKKTSSSE